MKVKVTSCPCKEYWWYDMVGEIIEVSCSRGLEGGYYYGQSFISDEDFYNDDGFEQSIPADCCELYTEDEDNSFGWYFEMIVDKTKAAGVKYTPEELCYIMYHYGRLNASNDIIGSITESQGVDSIT